MIFKLISILFLIYTSFEPLLLSSHFKGAEKSCPVKKFSSLTVTSGFSPIKMPPTCDKSLAYSGYLTVDNSQKAGLYAIFYGKKNIKFEDLPKHPLVIWLNGGPGSSSQIGNFYELGPCMLKKTGNGFQEFEREIPWTDLVNLLIVDQPIGTGGSITDRQESIPENEEQVAQHFFYALSQFYYVTPLGQMFTHTPLYITGESYAGKYVPNIAKKIMFENLKSYIIPLFGVAMGDGWTEPVKITQDLSTFAFQMGILDPILRIDEEYKLLKMSSLAWRGEWVKSKEIFEEVIDEIARRSGASDESFVYNMRQYAEKFNLSELNEFFSDPNVYQRYNLKCDKYQVSSEIVYQRMETDFMKPEAPSVEFILNLALPKVIIYQGQDDLIVNNAGVNRWVQEINWLGNVNDQWKYTCFSPWILNGDVVGYKKKLNNLEFRYVNKAGHFVPTDQSAVGLDLLASLIGLKD